MITIQKFKKMLGSKKFKVASSIVVTLLMLSGLSYEFYQNEYLAKRNVNKVIPKEEITSEVSQPIAVTKKEDASFSNDMATNNSGTNKTSTKNAKSYASDKTEYRNLSVEEWNAKYSRNLDNYEINYTPLKVCNDDKKHSALTSELERYLSEVSQIKENYLSKINILRDQYYIIDDKESVEAKELLIKIEKLDELGMSEINTAKVKSDANTLVIMNSCYE